MTNRTPGKYRHKSSLILRQASPTVRSVRRLLRNKATKAYLGEDGTWTPRLSQARHFDNTGCLIESAAAFTEAEMEILLMLNDAPSEFDIVLPLGLVKRTGEDIQHYQSERPQPR